MTTTTRIEHKLDQQHTENLWRHRRQRSAEDCTVNFCSNDYLGLSKHPAVIRAFQSGAEQYGVGSGGSPLVSGYTTPHAEFEQTFADWVCQPRALYCANGFVANLAVLTTLAQKGDRIFQDKLCHASLLDGAGYALAERKRYPHLDYQQLRIQLEHCDAQSHIVSDTVFSMDGDIADVVQLQALANEHGSTLILDEAHGFGVMGPEGKGCYAESVSHHPDDIVIYPLGKAMGLYGAMITGSDTMIESLIQFARPYIYSTAPLPALGFAGLAALKVLQKEPDHYQKLRSNIEYFQHVTEALQIPVQKSLSAIQPVILGSEHAALRVSDTLLKSGIQATAIRPPSVPNGTSRLRITINAQHSHYQIKRLALILQRTLRQEAQHA